MPFADFQALYKQKLTTADEAVKIIKSGDWVDYGFCAIHPRVLDEALARQRLVQHAGMDGAKAVIHPVTGLDDLHRLIGGGELLLVQCLKICKRHNMAPPCSFFPSHEGFPIPIDTID